MQTMVVGSRAVAKPVGLRLEAQRSLGQIELRFVVKMSGFGWEDGAHQAVHLVPTSAAVKLTAGAHESTFVCQADGRSAAPLASHPHDFELIYVHHVGIQALRAVEDMRDGAGITLEIWVHAGAIGVARIDFSTGRPFDVPTLFEPNITCNLIQKVSPDEWRSAVHPVLGERVIPLEVVVPTGSDSAEALQRALDHREGGRHDDAVAAVRVALDEIGLAGFGGRAPKDVINFIKHQASQLTMAERLAAVRAALELFCSPPHHGGQTESLTKEDSRFAIAVGAALLKLAQSRR